MSPEIEKKISRLGSMTGLRSKHIYGVAAFIFSILTLLDLVETVIAYYLLQVQRMHYIRLCTAAYDIIINLRILGSWNIGGLLLTCVSEGFIATWLLYAAYKDLKKKLFVPLMSGVAIGIIFLMAAIHMGFRFTLFILLGGIAIATLVYERCTRARLSET